MMQTGSSPQSHINVHLLPVPHNHHRLCRDLTGHSNDLGLPLHCVCRSRSPPTCVFLSLTDYFLVQEWLVSETDLLPKVVCHEWWSYELTEDGIAGALSSFQSNGVSSENFFKKEILRHTHLLRDFTTYTPFLEDGTVCCVPGTW